MPLTKDQIMTEALRLAPGERQHLAEELLLSLEPSDREQIDALWLAEARRRDAAFQAGKTGARTVDEVRQRLANKS